MTKKQDLPQRATPTILETPDVALAKTIGKMTSKDTVLEMLGNIENYGDVQRLAFFINMGSDEDLNISWLKDYAYTELALSNSLRTKTGGIRSEQLVRITKNPDVALNQNEGVIQRIRNRFSR